MREILFRGKLISNGEWAYGNLIVQKNGVSIITPDETVLGKYGQVQPESVGQYTGLTDKNGKKIFEGDILQYINGDNEPHNIKVVFFDGAFLIDDEGIINSDLLPSYRSLRLEVVGNIYDNSELLEVKELEVKER